MTGFCKIKPGDVFYVSNSGGSYTPLTCDRVGRRYFYCGMRRFRISDGRMRDEDSLRYFGTLWISAISADDFWRFEADRELACAQARRDCVKDAEWLARAGVTLTPELAEHAATSIRNALRGIVDVPPVAGSSS